MRIAGISGLVDVTIDLGPVGTSRSIARFDGAHNEASIRVLVEVLDSMPKKRTVFVVAIAQDKDIPAMLPLLASRADAFIVTRTSNPRAAAPADLKAMLARLCATPVRTAETPAAAFERARKLAAPGDRICVTGSMYLAGDVLRVIQKGGG